MVAACLQWVEAHPSGLAAAAAAIHNQMATASASARGAVADRHGLQILDCLEPGTAQALRRHLYALHTASAQDDSMEHAQPRLTASRLWPMLAATDWSARLATDWVGDGVALRGRVAVAEALLDDLTAAGTPGPQPPPHHAPHHAPLRVRVPHPRGQTAATGSIGLRSCACEWVPLRWRTGRSRLRRRSGSSASSRVGPHLVRFCAPRHARLPPPPDVSSILTRGRD